LSIRPYLLLVAAGIAAGLCLTPWGQSLDHVAYDTWFKLRGAEPVRDDIVFVAIDETSFQEIGQQWPWPRSVHAETLESIYQAGAKVVAFDILFPEPSDPAADAAFAEVLSRVGTTVLATDINVSSDNRFAVETIVEPWAGFQTPRVKLGHISTPSDSDGFVRRVEPQLRGFRSLGFEAALALTDGNCCIDLPEDTKPLLNFSGDTRSVTTYSYYQARDAARYLPDDALRDKLVIVGVSTMGNAMADERRPDHFPTPFTRWGGAYAPGSLVHANTAANLLNGSFINAASLPLTALVGFLIAAIFGFATFKLSFGLSSTIMGAASLSLLIASYFMFGTLLFYISPVALLLPMIAAYLFSPYYRYLQEARQRAYIRDTFSSYVNPEIVRQLEEDPAKARLGGKQIVGTALFLDIAGFTDLSERHSPEVVVSFINEFLSALIEIAMQHGGTVERFLGDAIMVIWGAPTDDADHAAHACAAAVDMANEIARIADLESQRLGAPVHARIGINSGSMTAGNIGGTKRFNYTVLGDSVNLAARLEGLNKVYKTTTIIGSETAAAISNAFVLRPLDKVTVKGRQQAEQIFELLGRSGSLAEQLQAAANAYALGLKHYQDGNWQSARDAFAMGLERRPDDGPCQTMLERCDDFLSSPPPETWSGVYDITSK